MTTLKLLLLSLTIGLLFSTEAKAQCVLHTGDIAFTGFDIYDDATNGNTQDDEFSFNLTKPIPSGTTIYFTDLGWTSSGAFQSFTTSSSPLVGAASDGEISWTSTVAMSAGAQVVIKCKYKLTANTGTVTGVKQTYNSTLVGTPAYLDLGIAGDQIFAFTGTLASPTFIAGIAINRSAWDAAVSNTNFTSCASQLPAALNVAGVQNLFISNAYNGYLPVTSSSSFATVAAWITYANTASNWTTDQSTTIPAPTPVPSTIFLNVSGAAFSTLTNPACQGETNVAYAIPSSTDYSAYTWSYSGTGLSGLSNGSNSQTVSFSNTATGGNLVVTPSGVCGTFPATTQAITVNPLPAEPGAFTTSTTTVSAGQTGVAYTVPNDATLTGYTWAYSGTGATINGATNSVTVDYSAAATSGNLSVAGMNGCGTGPAESLAIAVSAISSSPSSLPGGTAGASYTSTQLMGSGGTGPYTFAVSSGALPAGLTLVGSGTGAGTISGTPTAAGTFNFNITVTDATSKTGTVSYSITVAAPNIVVSPGSLPDGIYGTAYNQTFGASGGNGTYTYSVSSGTLPPGLTLSAAGSLTGMPTAAGSYIFTISAADQTTGAGAPYSGGLNYTLNINAASLTITADNQTKAYGAALPTLTATYSGFVNGDVASSLTTAPVLSTTATASSSVAGSPYTITASGAVDPNYTITYVPGILTVTPAALTITADNQTMVYGSAVPALTASYSGFVNGDVASSLTSAPVLSTTATASSSVAGSPYTITASGAVDANYTITYIPGILTVTPAALTITADNQTKAYGAALPTLTATYSGFVNGDNASSLTTAPTLSTTATASSSVAGNPYAITASGAVDANYTITYVPGILTVTPAALTITADNQTKAYGAALPTLTASYSGFVNGDNASSLTTAPTLSTTATASSSVAGNPYAITASGAVDPNYTITYVPGILTITPAALTITADNQTMVYGSAVPTLTASYSGFVNGDVASSLTTAPVLSTTATASSTVGGSPYPITASGAVDANYTITYVPGSLTVTPAALTITSDNQTMVYGSAVPALTVTYSGFVNGDNASSLTSAPVLSTTATASSSVAGSPYTITASGAVDANYTITYVPGLLTVTPAALTITADNQTMPYGGPLPTLTATYSGFVNGDNASSLSTAPTLSTTATAASSVAGGPYPITASGAVDANYTITYASGALTVTPAALTITADNQTMPYGGPLPMLTASYSGFVNGDNASSLTTAPTISTTATASSSVAGGPYPITASGAVDANYTITYAPGLLTVTPAALTITPDNQTMPYGGPLPTLTVSYSGFVNGDNASSLTTAPTLATTATAASSVAGGPYPITASGAVDANYTITYVPGLLTVTPAALTITADNQTMPYGGPLPTLTASYSGFVNGDNASSLTTAPTISTTATAASSVAGGPYPITASGAVDANYTITYVSGALTVTPAALTITADNQTMPYGGPLPTLTASYSGFVNGDNASSLSTAPTISTTATASSSVAGGPYPITASGAVDANYTITYVPGLLTVTPAALTITADNQTMPYGGPLPTLTASYSGFVNGDNASSLSTAPTLSTTATAASSVAGGPYPITASGAVDANYTITYVPGALTVTPAALTITADNQTMPYGGPLPTLTASYSGFVNGDNASSLTTVPTLSTTATASSSVAGGPYPITASGAVDANYTITYASGSLTVTPAALTITADNQTMPYGGPLPTLTASYSGFVNGDNASSLTTAPTLSTTATAASSVAGGPYPITASGAVDANYTITYVPGLLTVTPAALTITADNQTMPYGGPLPTLTASYSGFVNGDNASSLTTAPTLSTTATAASSVAGGPYPITASAAVDPNYTITYVGGSLTVTPAVLTITANNASMTYGSAVPALTAAYAGFVNGDNASSLAMAPTLSTTATAASSVAGGPYPITASGAIDPNYTITYVAGTLTITPAALTITAANASMTYGAAVPALSATYSGFVNGDNASSLSSAPAISTMATSESPVGTYPITATGAVDGNYTITYTDGTLTVNPATLTITADDQTKRQGDPNPTFTLTYTGFVNGQGPSILTTLPDVSTTATSSSPEGVYPILVNGGAAPNYTLAYVNGTLTILHPVLPNVITFNALPTKTYGDPDFQVSASASADLPVTFTSGDNSIATVTATGTPGVYTVHIVSAGQVTITAHQGGDSDYSQATDVDQVLIINKANQAIIFPMPAPLMYVTGTTTDLGASSSAGLPITYSLSSANLGTLSGNKLTFTGTGTLVVTANQEGDDNYNPAAPVSDTLQVYNSGSFIEGIGVFPNPAHGTLYIRMSQDYLVTSYSMYDLSGRRVLGQETVTNGSLTLQVDIGNLMQGMYILKVVAIRNHQIVFPAFKIIVQ